MRTAFILFPLPGWRGTSPRPTSNLVSVTQNHFVYLERIHKQARSLTRGVSLGQQFFGYLLMMHGNKAAWLLTQPLAIPYFDRSRLQGIVPYWRRSNDDRLGTRTRVAYQGPTRLARHGPEGAR